LDTGQAATAPEGIEGQFDDAGNAPLNIPGDPDGPRTPTDDQPTATPQAETEAPDGAPELDLPVPFRMADIEEELRPGVQRYIDSAKPAVTRAFQEAAQVKRQAAQALELQQALDSPDSAYEALSELLDRYNLELDRDSFDTALQSRAEPEADPYPDVEPGAGDEAIDYLLTREREREAAEREQAETEQAEEMRSTINGALSGFAEDLGYTEDDPLPEPIREDVLAHALAIPPLEDGMPDMDGAIERYKAAAAIVEQRYLRSKRGVQPPTGGGPGEKRLDIRNDRDRLEVANRVAARRVG
jgi:hypothetical protein